MRRWRRLDTESNLDRLEMLTSLKDWRYPRDLSADELDASLVFRYGDDCLLWLCPLALPKGEIAVHLCRQQNGTVVAVHEVFTVLKAEAQMAGFDRLVAAFEPERTDLKDYCSRLGWTEDERGFYVRGLGG